MPRGLPPKPGESSSSSERVPWIDGGVCRSGIQGASQVFVSTAKEDRLELAKKLGATVIDDKDDDSRANS